MINVLFSACMTLALTSCASKSVPLPPANCPVLLPPESALTECEVPEFVGTGSANIIYTTADGAKTATCAVTVTA